MFWIGKVHMTLERPFAEDRKRADEANKPRHSRPAARHVHTPCRGRGRTTCPITACSATPHRESMRRRVSPMRPQTAAAGQ